MTERQNHGFNTEQAMIEKYNLTKNQNYTGIWDAYTQEGVPVSIKTAKKGSSICLGSWHRQADISTDFIMIVAFWEGSKSHIVEEHVLKIPYKKWLTYYPDQNRQEIVKLFNGVLHTRDYDPVWKEKLKLFKKSTYDESNPIQMNAKRDHKKQLRMQCSITSKNFNSMIEKWGKDAKVLGL